MIRFRWMLLVCVLTVSSAAAGETAKNVILFIGDGMGVNQVKAASYYHAGEDGALAMHALPRRAMMTTHSTAKVTDSAASATAMATGRKVDNGVIAKAIPGDGQPLTTILELFKQRGAWTGLVTNDSLLGATPAAFAAHQKNRGMARPIADDYLTKTRPNVMFGGGGPGLDAAEKHGYLVARDLAEFKQLPGKLATSGLRKDYHLAGIFGPERFEYFHLHPDAYEKTYPRLNMMTGLALRMLNGSPKGFFLMVESALIDKSGHNQRVENDTQRTWANITETLEFDRAVQVARDFAKAHPDTLIIVTADHECGGLKLLENRGQGNWPDVKWTTTGHTADAVDVFAVGPGSEKITGTIDNTDIYRIIVEAAGLDAGGQ